MSFKVGENIGPYQLLEQVGEGGMGTVFKAYHPSLDRYVALKLIHPAHRQDQTFVARFQREARLVARLEHPNIVPVYDYAEHEKTSYLVMKFIEGTTLKDRLAQSPVTSHEILQIVDSVGSALSYAHTQGILHRDIKPSNVLIGTSGIMYLADFGLARITHAEASTLSSESKLGTPHYVSPEQAMGRNDLDRRTDIYSFGVMLYEIIVGQPPFNDKAGFAIIHDHIYSPIPLPRTLNPTVSEPVQQVLLKALAKDPSDRYENIPQMISAFRDAWLNPSNSISPILPAASPVLPVATFDKVSLDQNKSMPQKQRQLGWLYGLLGIVVGIVMAFALVPNLRGNLVAVLKSKIIPAISIESTPTVQVVNTGTTFTPKPERTPITEGPNLTATPIPNSTNTSAPNLTVQPTQPVPNVLTLPPILETIVPDVPSAIETVGGQATQTIPGIISSLLP